MDAQVLLNGKLDLGASGHPARRRFRVSGPKQLLFASGSIYYDRVDVPAGKMPPSIPMDFGVAILVDGRNIGSIRIGKSDERTHSAAVPAFFALELAPGEHEIDLQNTDMYQSSPNDFFCITVFDL